MHFRDGDIPKEYTGYIRRKILVLIGGVILLLISLIVSISLGAVTIAPKDVVMTLLGNTVTERIDTIILKIRLPQALTAIFAGAGLSVAGVIMQSILRNPLGSPFTLGLSNAAAFGAALAVMFVGGLFSISNSFLTTGAAFIFSIINAGVIIAISKMRNTKAETMILTGIALGSMFTAGTMFLQYFADDIQLATMVFWTFGDVARANWTQLGIIGVSTLLLTLYFQYNSWNYNAIDAGDETARGLGINVDKVRILGMLATSLLTSVIVSFLGIISFIGLVCPHMMRRLIGGDMRFLIPGSVLMGALLLLASDTAARLILAPHVLPVSVLTAFLGAPVFIALIIKGVK